MHWIPHIDPGVGSSYLPATGVLHWPEGGNMKVLNEWEAPWDAEPSALNDLVRDVVKHVYETGLTPVDATDEIVTPERHDHLPEADRLRGFRVGVARLVNKVMDMDRSRQSKQRWDQEQAAIQAKRDADRDARQEEIRLERKRWAEFYAYPDGEGLKAEARRLHDMTGCDRKECAVAANAVRCLGGVDVLFMPVEQREGMARTKLQELHDAVARRKLALEVHERLHCQRALCAKSESEAARCARRAVLSYPEHEWPRRIATCCAANDKLEAKKQAFYDTLRDEGARQAIAALQSLCYLAADRSMRSLYRFEDDDLAMWDDHYDTLVGSMARRRDWCREARRALKECGAKGI
jgi:hypothetical protein